MPNVSMCLAKFETFQANDSISGQVGLGLGLQNTFININMAYYLTRGYGPCEVKGTSLGPGLSQLRANRLCFYVTGWRWRRPQLGLWLLETGIAGHLVVSVSRMLFRIIPLTRSSTAQ